MADRDRLAADLAATFRELGTRSDPTAKGDGWPAYQEHRDEAVVLLVSEVADRLIALGWARLDDLECLECGGRATSRPTPLDEERLARALDKITDVGIYPGNSRSSWQEGWNAACIAIAERLDDHAAIAKAYREDEGG